MVKCTFVTGNLRCFIAETTDMTLINELYNLIGQIKWVVGIIRSGTGNNICNSTSHSWHYETFIYFAETTAEECQTTIEGVESDSSYWLYRNVPTCITGKLTNIDCPQLLCSYIVE